MSGEEMEIVNKLYEHFMEIKHSEDPTAPNITTAASDLVRGIMSSTPNLVGDPRYAEAFSLIVADGLQQSAASLLEIFPLAEVKNLAEQNLVSSDVLMFDAVLPAPVTVMEEGSELTAHTVRHETLVVDYSVFTVIATASESKENASKRVDAYVKALVNCYPPLVIGVILRSLYLSQAGLTRAKPVEFDGTTLQVARMIRELQYNTDILKDVNGVQCLSGKLEKILFENRRESPTRLVMPEDAARITASTRVNLVATPTAVTNLIQPSAAASAWSYLTMFNDSVAAATYPGWGPASSMLKNKRATFGTYIPICFEELYRTGQSMETIRVRDERDGAWKTLSIIDLVAAATAPLFNAAGQDINPFGLGKQLGEMPGGIDYHLDATRRKATHRYHNGRAEPDMIAGAQPGQADGGSEQMNAVLDQFWDISGIARDATVDQEFSVSTSVKDALTVLQGVLVKKARANEALTRKVPVAGSANIYFDALAEYAGKHNDQLAADANELVETRIWLMKRAKTILEEAFAAQEQRPGDAASAALFSAGNAAEKAAVVPILEDYASTLNGGYPLPFDLLLFREAMYDGSHAFLAAPGPDTGKVMIKDPTWSFVPQSRAKTYHLTTGVGLNPDVNAIVPARNAFVSNYKGGGDVGIIMPEDKTAGTYDRLAGKVPQDKSFIVVAVKKRNSSPVGALSINGTMKIPGPFYTGMPADDNLKWGEDGERAVAVDFWGWNHAQLPAVMATPEELIAYADSPNGIMLRESFYTIHHQTRQETLQKTRAWFEDEKSSTTRSFEGAVSLFAAN